MSAIPVVAVAFKTVTLAIGLAVTFLAARAYRRVGDPGLGWLAAGFGVVTAGALLAGVADQVLMFEGDAAIVIESALTTVGFAIVAYSLYVTSGRSKSW